MFSCPHCPFTADSVSNLRRHCTNIHKNRIYRVFPRTIVNCSHHGRPQCNHCFQQFTSWRNFVLHIERNCCQAPSLERMDLESYNRDPTGRLRLDRLHLTQTQPFGPRMLEILEHRSWNQIADHRELCSYLSHNCCICGVWTSRPQELNSHLKLHHGTHLEGVWLKSAQLSSMLMQDRACRFCCKTFVKQHTCNVLTQVAVLWMSSLTPDDRKAEILRCSICDVSFSDTVSLHRHLREAHVLQFCDWSVSRDRLPGSGSACRHCGLILETLDGLRQHIITGRCQSFDSQARHITQQPQQRWMEVLLKGNIHELTPSERLALTLKCQLCSESYSRQIDLAAHLQTAHSDVWMRSLPLTRFMVDMVMPELGCRCNPSTTDTGVQHICPLYRQLSMLQLTGPSDLFVPMQYTAAKIEHFLSTVPSQFSNLMIQKALLDRQFEQLWSLPAVTQLLSNRCLLCGLMLHPGNLCAHLAQEHPQAVKL